MLFIKSNKALKSGDTEYKSDKGRTVEKGGRG